MEELQTCHSEAYTLMYGTSPEKFSPKLFEVLSPRFCKLACTGIGVDADTVWNNDWTPTSTRMVGDLDLSPPHPPSHRPPHRPPLPSPSLLPPPTVVCDINVHVVNVTIFEIIISKT